MATPILYGPAYSTYARSARLAFEEKGVAYKLEEVDILNGAAQAPDYQAKHPFGKVPVLAHDGFTLYETTAITHYIDESFPGPKLQPSDARQRARMNQIIAVIDSYAYPALIGKVVIQRIQPILGGTTDEKVIAEAMPLVEKGVKALEILAEGGSFLVGQSLSLADLHLAPVLAYFSTTPEGQKTLAGAPRLSRWWQQISTRPSMTQTQPSLGSSTDPPRPMSEGGSG